PVSEGLACSRRRGMGGLRGDGGQLHGDCGALAGLAGDRERAAMEFDQRLRNGESEARAALGLGELVLDLLERTAELLDILGRNADAGIGDRNNSMIAIERGRKRDTAAFRCELYRIGGEVDQNLLDRADVDIGLELPRRMADQLDLAFLGARLD